MIREYRTVLENLEISLFAQLLQKARKTAQSVKPSFDNRNTPQVMAVSTGERKRKSNEREYDTLPPLPCTLKELDLLLDKWIAMESLSLIKFLESPLNKSGGTHASATCTIICNILHLNVGLSAD